MKQIKLLTTTAILSIVLSCCKKDKVEPAAPVPAAPVPPAPPVITTETPFKATIEGNVIVNHLLQENLQGGHEMGYKFHSPKAGKITKLGCLVPVAGKYHVSLWNYDNQSLIKTAEVVVTDVTKFSYADITGVNITSNKNYMISVNNTEIASGKYIDVYSAIKDHYVHIYPFTIGNITIEKCLYIPSLIPKFPSQAFSNVRIWGIPDFVFEY